MSVKQTQKCYKRIFRCMYCCYASTQSISRIYEHLWDNHQRELPYRCTTCHKPFPGPNELNFHRRYNHVKKGKRKKRRGNAHQGRGDSSDGDVYVSLTDPNIAEFKNYSYRKGSHECPICDARHGSANMLQDHVLCVHYNMVDNYRCEDCTVRCASSKSLAHHIKTVHGSAQEISCQYCDNHKFRSKLALYKHLKTFHPDNVVISFLSQFGSDIDPYIACLVMGGSGGDEFKVLTPVLTRDTTIHPSIIAKVCRKTVAENIASIFSLLGVKRSVSEVCQLIDIEYPLDIKPRLEDIDMTTRQVKEDDKETEPIRQENTPSPQRKVCESEQPSDDELADIPNLVIDFNTTEQETALSSETNLMLAADAMDTDSGTKKEGKPDKNSEKSGEDNEAAESSIMSGNCKRQDVKPENGVVKSDPECQLPADIELRMTGIRSLSARKDEDNKSATDNPKTVENAYTDRPDLADFDSRPSSDEDSDDDIPVKRRKRIRAAVLSSDSDSPNNPADDESGDSDSSYNPADDETDDGDDSEDSETGKDSDAESWDENILDDSVDCRQQMYGFEVLQSCPICDIRVKAKHLKIHIRSKHPSNAAIPLGRPEYKKEGYQCDECPFSSKWRKSMRLHKLRFHVENPPVLQCDKCVFNTLCAASLRNHKKRVHDQLRFQCSQCTASYGNATDLKDHFAMKHENRYPRKCTLCPYECGFRSDLYHHMKRYHNCSKAGCSFQHADPMVLYNHMLNEHDMKAEDFMSRKKWACIELGCGFVATTKEKGDHLAEVHGIHCSMSSSVGPLSASAAASRFQIRFKKANPAGIKVLSTEQVKMRREYFAEKSSAGDMRSKLKAVSRKGPHVPSTQSSFRSAPLSYQPDENDRVTASHEQRPPSMNPESQSGVALQFFPLNPDQSQTEATEVKREKLIEEFFGDDDDKQGSGGQGQTDVITCESPIQETVGGESSWYEPPCDAKMASSAGRANKEPKSAANELLSRGRVDLEVRRRIELETKRREELMQKFFKDDDEANDLDQDTDNIESESKRSPLIASEIQQSRGDTPGINLDITSSDTTTGKPAITKPKISSTSTVLADINVPKAAFGKMSSVRSSQAASTSSSVSKAPKLANWYQFFQIPKPPSNNVETVQREHDEGGTSQTKPPLPREYLPEYLPNVPMNKSEATSSSM